MTAKINQSLTHSIWSLFLSPTKIVDMDIDGYGFADVFRGGGVESTSPPYFALSHCFG